MSRTAIQYGHLRRLGDAGGGVLCDQHDLVHAQDGPDDAWGSIEQKIAKYTGPEGVSKIGLFFFVFLLVLREGVETVLILSAVTLNSTELLSFTGTLLGIAVAVVFGVLFIRGSVKINLQRFFRVTTVILYFVAFQLIVSGLHELSENGVLPSSTDGDAADWTDRPQRPLLLCDDARAGRADDADGVQAAGSGGTGCGLRLRRTSDGPSGASDARRCG